MACGQQVLHTSCCLAHCAFLTLQSGAFPISKVRQARSFIHSTPQKSFRHNFFGRFTAASVARGGGRESDKGGLCGARYQHGDLPRVEEKVRRDGSQRGQEVKSIGRGKLAG